MSIQSKITDQEREKISLLLTQETNSVIKERLQYVSMYANGMTKRDIGKKLGRSKDTVGNWINKYFENGLDGIQEKRGGDHKSFLTLENKQELKEILLKPCPTNDKGWSGWIIVDLIKTKYGVTYTRGGVYALLKSLDITDKIAT